MGSSPKSGAPTEQFNIRWKNYTSVLHSTFRDLLEEERLVDVTLAVDGGFIKCHRIILSACSSYFENLLNELGSDGNNGGLVIFMKDLKLWELQALIHFMYNGEVSVRQNRLAPLVRAAESLHIRGLSAEVDERSPRGGGGGRNSFDNGADPDSTHSAAAAAAPKRIVRRPSSGVNLNARGPDQGQNQKIPAPAAGAVQPVKRSSISNEAGSGSGVPSKIMKTVQRGQESLLSRPNSASASTSASGSGGNGNGGSQFQRPKLVINRSKSAGEDSPRSTLIQQKIQSRSNSNEGMVEDSGEVVDIKDEAEDSVDKVSEFAEVEGEPNEEAVYSDEAEENPYYDDGTGYVDEAESVQGGEPGSGGMMIMDPPITIPVIDAADRAERLKKATDLALSGITVRQAAAHYGIPRTTLCAYMKRRGYAGKRLTPGGVTHYQQTSLEGENFNEENEFPFLGLADLLKGQPNYEIQGNTC